MLMQWHAGDILTFDWPNIPHCTANASLLPRPLLQVTGVVTETTEAMLTNGSPDARYPV